MSICGKEMEDSSNHKSLERVVSQRALQMGSSFPCQICVVGFLCGVCLTGLFLAAFTSFGTSEFGGFSISTFSSGITSWNSSSDIIDMVTHGDCNPEQVPNRKLNLQEIPESNKLSKKDSISTLYNAWSDLLDEPANAETSNVPKAPHFQDCKSITKVNQRLDSGAHNETLPPWTVWRGFLDTFPVPTDDEQLKYYRHRDISRGAYPPWITGSDEENYPLTRKVQRDIWVHQHPSNCSDPDVKFLLADWETLPGFGIGAQIAGMCGLLAIAINEKRVLVTSYYNRADHDGCKGKTRSRWSCYFLPEASQECQDRAFQLMGEKEAWDKRIITGKDNYSSKEIWSGRTPRNWGMPWSYLQPTTDINGTLISHHRKMDRRWWRAQVKKHGRIETFEEYA